MKWLAVLLISLAVGTAVAAPLDLHYGVNEVDINGDGVKDMIVKVRWENFNAHSFDRYLVMVRLEGEDYPQGVYEVPKGRNYDYVFRTEEAADCQIAAYNFTLNRHDMLEVTAFVKARWQETFCEPQPVTITTYRLTDGVKEDGMAAWGTPPYYLKEVRSAKTTRKYEDVSSLLK